MIPKPNGSIELRFGAYDRAYHFLNAATGLPTRPELMTGDLAKGSATSDPDGYPLYYAGSRDNFLRIVALDRGRPKVLWQVNADTSVPKVVWNNDWDGAPLIVGDYLIEGGENSWLYVIRLHRGYGPDGKVRVRPRFVARVPSWDKRLLAATTDRAFSIENSVSFRNGIVYFANSAGLVQGWDIRAILHGGSVIRRVFRFWTGDDTDASVVVDRQGFLYVASELELFDKRSKRVGQLLKLDPGRPQHPLVWSVPLTGIGRGGKGGSWSTPALELWQIRLGGCIESTPAVWRGRIYIGTRGGAMYALGHPRP